jgi:EpsI family protein
VNQRIFTVIIVLALSFGFQFWSNAAASTPERESLESFPKQAGSWKMTGEQTIDPETAAVLKADDYMLRHYRAPTGRPVEFFIAYYRTQKAGESMHSPRNCLPGAGWEIVSSDEVRLAENGPEAIQINRYIIEKGRERALMLFWYQAIGRVIASEYWGKFYLVWDAARTRRRDGAIVRLVVPVAQDSDGMAELKSGLDLAEAARPLLPRYVPN